MRLYCLKSILLRKNTAITYDGKKCLIDNNASCKILFSYADRIGKCDDYFSNYGERAVRGNLWKGFSSDGGNLAKEGKVSFKNGKKPIRLIKQLIDSVENCNSVTVLDFFAGFRVIIMTQANSQVNTRVLELLPKFKIKKMNRWCTV